MFQTGSSFVNNSTVTISEVQRQVAMESLLPNGRPIFLVAPYYQVTCHAGHRDNNGYRWMGAYAGKVMDIVLNKEQGWLPLCPIELVYIVLGGVPIIRISFHVPEPPLQWGMAYHYNYTTGQFDMPNSSAWNLLFSTKGFAVTDASGTVPIASVNITSDSVVDIQLGRTLGANGVVNYGGYPGADGMGLLCDSDPAISDESYLYVPNDNYWNSSNLPSLEGNPFVLNNYCVLFSMAVTYSDSAVSNTAVLSS